MRNALAPGDLLFGFVDRSQKTQTLLGIFPIGILRKVLK